MLEGGVNREVKVDLMFRFACLYSTRGSFRAS